MNVNFPFHFDSRGRTADTTGDDHIRGLIEQVLFTTPGERVNRPTFGSGLLQLVFAPIDDALAGAVQMSVQGALQQWLGELILVEAVQVESLEEAVQVTVHFVVRQTQERQVARFEKSV